MRTLEITRLSRVQRANMVADHYAYRPDRFHLALAGLDRINAKQARQQTVSDRSSSFVVEKISRTVVNGEVVESHLYLTNQLLPGTLKRRWGVAGAAKKFSGIRDAQRARINREDPDARVIPHTEMVVDGDQLSNGGL